MGAKIAKWIDMGYELPADKKLLAKQIRSDLHFKNRTITRMDGVVIKTKAQLGIREFMTEYLIRRAEKMSGSELYWATMWAMPNTKWTAFHCAFAILRDFGDVNWKRERYSMVVCHRNFVKVEAPDAPANVDERTDMNAIEKAYRKLVDAIARPKFIDYLTYNERGEVGA